ncbi:MAG: hypothetical protein ACYC2P_04450 [Paludibacteraceae bacterium]
MSKSFFNKFMDRLRYGSKTENEKIEKTQLQNEPFSASDEKEVFTETRIPVSETKNLEKKPIEGQPDKSISNIVELNELTIQAIINAMSAIKYSDVRLSEIHLHLRKEKQDPTSLAVESLFKNEKFMENLKYKLTDAGIHYMDGIKVKIIYSSAQIDNYTKLAPDLSIQALTFEDSKKLQKLIITALTGILWENEVELVPRKKPYFIGRCKMPELDKSAKIINDIAFVGPEENDDPRYEVNRYVSRSIAKIVYNDKTGNFEVMRSNLINNKQHVIKIIRIADGVQQISINNTEVAYTLQDDDQIVFNDRVALLVNVADLSES